MDEEEQIEDISETFYMKKIREILNYSMEKYHRNEFFPIWGTCLGFESMLVSYFNYRIPIESRLNDYNVDKRFG